ncbi:hypothetical protein B0H66DRAFT_613996 [Apodospora peruviana]|uniref:Uncharacterized protein n=1 Tax=Apodospora peruviana TaxID=516989 RepID=A0AAE0MGM2_9PEZI|nr:hypothetical protein B0H66DRAFT_613996 [Apodospora peruviana]
MSGSSRSCFGVGTPVIPVDDKQFWASNLTTTKYLACDWESTAAPWVRLMGGSTFRKNDLFLALRRSWRCEASDPRDKNFGILGLLRPDGQINSLVPDYRISTRHTFIGDFAHLLINLGVASVLMSASGLAAPPGYPSWVPHWQSSQPLGGSGSLDYAEELGRQKDAEAAAWPARMHAPSRRNLCSPHTTPVFLVQSAALEGRHASRKVLAARGATVPRSTPRPVHSLPSSFIFQFDSSPSRTEVRDLYEVISEPCALHIMTKEGGPPLDALAPPGHNHLFCIEREEGEADDPKYHLVFMRKIADPEPEAVKSFKFILCCPCDDMFLLCPDLLQRQGTNSTPGWHHISLLHTLHCAIPEAQQMIPSTRSTARWTV